MENKILLKISFYIGLIAFAGGWAIFLVWTGGRYIGAWDFEILEIIGLFWIAAFFWISLFGLLTLIIYILINRRSLHLKMLYAGLMILVNIPSVQIILSIQGDIENKVFVNLENQSGIDDIELHLQGNQQSWNIGKIDNGSSKVFNYDPPHLNDGESWLIPDTLNLIIKNKENIDTTSFPALGMGECRHLIIDDDLNIKIR